MGVAADQAVAHQKPEDGITQELQLFVVLEDVRFGRVS
jgi:hypothetical protein